MMKPKASNIIFSYRNLFSFSCLCSVVSKCVPEACRLGLRVATIVMMTSHSKCLRGDCWGRGGACDVTGKFLHVHKLFSTPSSVDRGREGGQTLSGGSKFTLTSAKLAALRTLHLLSHPQAKVLSILLFKLSLNFGLVCYGYRYRGEGRREGRVGKKSH